MTAFEDIQKAKSLIASNQRVAARQVLSALVQSEPSNAQAWLLLSYVTESKDQAIYCLERAVKIDPLNHEIRERLKQFKTPPAQAAPMQRSQPQPQPYQQPRPQSQQQIPKSMPTQNMNGMAVRANDTPIYTVIGMLSILVLLWISVALIQMLTSATYANQSGSVSLCLAGLWNVLASLLNGYLLMQVTQKKKSAIRSLYLLSAAGVVLGVFQLFVDAALVQACAIPLYVAVGFFTYVEKDKFIN